MSDGLITEKALLKIGYKCNYTCSFCHAEYKKNIKEINIKALFFKILLLKKKGVKIILLSGGESTLESHFFSVIDFIKKQGLDFGIVTNGSTISSDRFLDKLFDLGIKNIYLSIHGYGTIHDDIVGCKGSYEGVIKIIGSLKKRSFDSLFLNYVVISDNLSSIEDTLNGLLKTSYENLSIKFSLLEPSGAGNNDALFCSPKEASLNIKSAIEMFDGKGIKIYWDGFPLCLFLGDLEKRADLKTEKINYITEVYENKLYNTDYGRRSYLPECGKCDFKDDCYGIFDEYISAYGQSDLINI
ncbi:radical SAM protein [Candidatus Gracilibacteria bacterium 28_42_T64]|nr:radical SAM protein [Candidatus Gracilibacteria bacterium 28_42_T64]